MNTEYFVIMVPELIEYRRYSSQNPNLCIGIYFEDSELNKLYAVDFVARAFEDYKQTLDNRRLSKRDKKSIVLRRISENDFAKAYAKAHAKITSLTQVLNRGEVPTNAETVKLY